MTAPAYGATHRGRVLRPDSVAGQYVVEVPAIAPGCASGPFPSAVRDLAAGDRILLTQIGLTGGDLVITSRIPERGPDVTLPIDIDDVVGLQTALDDRATDAELAALDTRVDTAEADISALEAADVALDGRLDTAESTLTSHGTRLTTAEGTVTSHGTRLTTAEGTITSHGTRLTTAETNITALQARKVKIYPRTAAVAAVWTSGFTTTANTAYVVASLAIADPGWSYYIGGAFNMTISAATGGPYSHEATMRVDDGTSPSGPHTSIVCHNFMRTINGGLATFSATGTSPTIWTGAHSVYLIVRCGSVGVFDMGNWSLHKNYIFDVTVTPA